MSNISDTRSNPYVGPRAFREGEKLYGRKREVSALKDLLIARRIVLLHAPSGAGKTSLIRAALLPELADEGFQALPVARVNFEPEEMSRLATLENFNRYSLSVLHHLDSEGKGERDIQIPSLASVSLKNYLDNRIQEAEEDTTLVLILDQFEEILTVDSLNLEAKEAFFKSLGEALENRDLWVLFAMRDDYLGALDPFISYLPTGLSNRYHLELLGRDAAKEAIQSPAAEPPFNVEFTDQAAYDLADDLRLMTTMQPDGKTRTEKGPYVEPVHLQVVCRRLWEQPRSQPGVISKKDVKERGQVDITLGEYYRDSVRETAQGTGVREREIRDWFDHHLITQQRVRSQVLMGFPHSQGLDNQAIASLIDAYLVREEKKRGLTFFELAHDRLVNPILQSNEAWRKNNLQEWQRTADRWGLERRPDDLLLVGQELDNAENWAISRYSQLNVVEKDYLASSVEARDEELSAASQKRSIEAERRTNLADLGWGVIFPENADPDVQEALRELLELRQEQAGENFKILTYWGIVSETAQQFLVRHGAGSGPTDTEKVPYYLLIVGDPESIPFEFQYGLAVQYAVGRIDFDSLQEYASYARSVVTAEAEDFAPMRRGLIFGPQIEDQGTSAMVIKSLLEPLQERLSQTVTNWQIESLFGEDASRGDLSSVLNGAWTPSLLNGAWAPSVLFTASHGLDLSGRDPEPEEMRELQGALVFEGLPDGGSIPPESYFSGGDVSDDARLLGSMFFLFGPYTAGTSARDDYAHLSLKNSAASSRSFVARLPQKLLGHPAGGALAVYGHVERTGVFSFPESSGLEQVSVYFNTLNRLMGGYTAGSAMEAINQRYSLFVSQLGDSLRERIPYSISGEELLDPSISNLLTATTDARNYILLGDPAVHLPVDRFPPPDAERPQIERVQVPVPEVETPKSVEMPEEVVKFRKRRITIPTQTEIQYADLEIGLNKPVNGLFTVELRFSRPDEAVSLAPVRGGAQFDLDGLQSLLPDVEAYGRLLSENLFASEEVISFFKQIIATVKTTQTPLRVRLFIDQSASELMSLRWETLRNPLDDSLLTMSENTIFTRFLYGSDWSRVQIKPGGPLRALVVVADPFDLPLDGFEAYGDSFSAIDVESEVQRANSILSEVQDISYLVSDRDVPGGVTLENIVSFLRNGYDILYLVCFTAAEVDTNDAVLWFESMDGMARAVPAAEFTQRIRELEPSLKPRLVLPLPKPFPHPGVIETDLVLKHSVGQIASGTLGPLLAQAGVPAVLAMQAEISEETLSQFMVEFIRELLKDGWVDRAFTQARMYVRDYADWWVPVLLSRLRGGRLWSQPGYDAPAQPAAELEMNYAFLEIRFSRQEDGEYFAGLRFKQPGSEGEVRSTPDRVWFDLQELRAAQLDLTQYGRILSESLFRAPSVIKTYYRAVAIAENLGIPLRLRISIDPSAHELNAVSWEAMHDPDYGTPLGMSERILLSRYTESKEFRITQIPQRERLRILIAVASPAEIEQEYDLTPLEIEGEIEMISTPLDAQEITRLPSIDGSKRVTLENIVSHLDKKVYDIVYLECHSTIKESDAEPDHLLMLERDDSTADIVYADQFVKRLAELPAVKHPRMFILATVKGAGDSDVDHFRVAVGTRLARMGIPAVLAYRGNIYFETHQLFVPKFFIELLRHGEVDRAVAVARSQIIDRPDAYAPVLFQHPESGRLWNIIKPGEEITRPTVYAVYNVPDLPDSFVPRAELFNQLQEMIIGQKRSIHEVALVGLGGIGKSVLATAACHAKPVRDAFPDGILWATLGERPNMQAIFEEWLSALTGVKRSFSNIGETLWELNTALGDRRLLFVIDDMRTQYPLKHLYEVGENCVLLITTRDHSHLSSRTEVIQVRAMGQEEALKLLAGGLPLLDLAVLEPLANALHNLPLLLSLANAVLRQRVLESDHSIDEAVDYTLAAFKRRGVTAFDARQPTSRSESLAVTLDEVIDQLQDDEKLRLTELSIFPRQTRIPLDTIMKYWKKTASMTPGETKKLCRRYYDLSLASYYDQELQIHPIVHDYVLGRVDDILVYHDLFVESYRLKNWHKLRPNEPYMWDYLTYHLNAALRVDELRNLLLNYDWIESSIKMRGAASLLNDYKYLPDDPAVQLVAGAIRLPADLLEQDVQHLPSQLLGRLLNFVESTPELLALLERASKESSFAWLRPLNAGLTSPGGPLQRTLTGHSDSILSALLTPDGGRLITTSRDTTIKVWDTTNWRELRVLQGHNFSVLGAAITPDGERLISVSDGEVPFIWDLRTGEVIDAVEEIGAVMCAVVLTPDGQRAIFGSPEGTLTLWDIADNKEIRTWQVHEARINDLALTPDGKRVVAACEDHTISVWNLARGRQESVFRDNNPYTGVVNALLVTPDGEKVISTSADKTIKVWNLIGAFEMKTLQGHTDAVLALAMTPDGRYLVSGSADRSVKIWDWERGTLIRNLEGHSDSVTGVAVSPDGRQVISASADRTVKVWDLNQAASTVTAVGHFGPVNDVAVAGLERDIAVSASGDGSLKVWDIKESLLDGLARGRELRTLTAVDADTSSGVASIVFISESSIQATMIAAYEDGSLRDWDIKRSSDGRLLEHPGTRVNDMVIGQRRLGFLAVLACEDHTLRVSDIMLRDMEKKILRGHEKPVRSVALVGKRMGNYVMGIKFIVSASEDQSLIVWDLKNYQVQRRLTGHTKPVNAVAAIPGPSQVASASDDHSIIVWDVEVGQVLNTITGHEDRVMDVSAFPKNRLILSAGLDTTLKVWNVDSGELIASYHADRPFLTCDVSEDGTFIIAGDENGGVHFLEFVSE